MFDTILKCLIRFLNLLFTILKFFRQCYVGDVAKISADRSDHALATRSLREDQALLLCRRLPLVPNKASSDAGPELAGRESRAAMESPQALMCPLEKGGDCLKSI